MWAKVINDEIMQLSEDNPEGLWHPDFLQYWQEVSDEVNIGWKFKNGKWIPGGQWLEEFIAENPPPLPGPPTAIFDVESKLEGNVIKVLFFNTSAGDVEDVLWTINGQSYTDNTVELSFNLSDTLRTETINVKLEATGPGGTDTIENQEQFKIPIATV